MCRRAARHFPKLLLSRHDGSGEPPMLSAKPSGSLLKYHAASSIVNTIRWPKYTLSALHGNNRREKGLCHLCAGHDGRCGRSGVCVHMFGVLIPSSRQDPLYSLFRRPYSSPSFLPLAFVPLTDRRALSLRRPCPRQSPICDVQVRSRASYSRRSRRG